MKIEYIRLKNFKSLQDIEMRDIPDMCVLVGANGSGKSTLFSLFGFLKDALTDNVHVALTKLGGSRGYQEVRSRNSEGPIEIELKFRDQPSSPLVTYSLTISEENGRPIIEREALKYRRGSKGQPWRFLDFSRGQGTAVTNEPAEVTDVAELVRDEQTLKSADILAIKGLAQFKRFPAVVALGNLIENWHISDFHIQRAKPEQGSRLRRASVKRRRKSLVSHRISLRSPPETFNRIIDAMKHRVPGITRIAAKTTEEGRVLLKFQDGAFEDPFLARHVSDGTIKMFAYLVLLYDPQIASAPMR